MENGYAKYCLNVLLRQILSIKDMLYDKETIEFFGLIFLIDELKMCISEYLKVKQVYIDNIVDTKDIIFIGDVEVEY